MSLQITSVFVMSGVVLAGIGLPLMRRSIPPNRWFGIRLPSTLADERVWYAVNERSGRDMVIVGMTVIVVAFGTPYVLRGWLPEFRAILVALVLVVGLMATTRRAARHVKRLRPDGMTRR